VALVTAVACATVFTTLLALWAAYPAWPIDGLRGGLDFWRPMRVLSRRGTVGNTPTEIFAFLFEPAVWPVVFLFVWLLAALVARVLPRNRTRPAALDAVWRDTATLLRFLATWASLLVLMLAAMVTLGWAGYLLAAFVHF
jgi:hypothetical protein